jgi:hypothetical protein
MRDRDVRSALLGALHQRFGADPDTLVVEELALARGDARIDIALVNGRLEGFEIKSARDTLGRLPAQARAYSRLFERLTIVVDGRHIDHLGDVVPSWWGVQVAHGTPVVLTPIRRAKLNPAPDPAAAVELLWRDELLTALHALQADHGVRSATVSTLASRLLRVCSSAAVYSVVREALKARQGWRAAW